MLRLKALLALVLIGASCVVGAAPEIHEFTLDNGMKVIVRPDHRAPVVVSQVWYKVGSSYEHRGITGVSHVLEHMMFKGTARHPAGEFSRIVALNGGRENAFTSRDYTGYYQQIAVDRLPIVLELEADRLANLRFSEAEFKKELQVVMEERRLRTDDDPISLGMERFGTVVYPISPYRNPVIGWMEDLKTMTLAEVKDWYARWYTPSNAILVVVGDVKPEAVLALAKKYFGGLKARPVPDPGPPLALESPGERRFTTRLPTQVPYLAISYQAPSLATAEDAAEPYALEVLSAVLDGGASARLESELVRGAEVAAGVRADYGMATRLGTQFSLGGYPARGKDLATLEAALLAQVEKLKSEPVSAEELARAKNQIIADHLYQMDSIFYQAMQIGILETTGIGWRSLLEYEERIRAVTPAMIQAAARKYLTDERRATMHLLPLAAQQGAR